MLRHEGMASGAINQATKEPSGYVSEIPGMTYAVNSFTARILEMQNQLYAKTSQLVGDFPLQNSDRKAVSPYPEGPMPTIPEHRMALANLEQAIDLLQATLQRTLDI